MKKTLLFSIAFFSILTLLKAQSPGGIAFVGFDADGSTDGFSFVLLQDAPAGTGITFNENEWDGSSFGSGESVIEWSVTDPLPEGTVVTITGLNSSVSADMGTATITAGAFNLGGSNEALYAYKTGSSPIKFISAISNESFDSGSSVGSLANTGLVEGVTAMNIDGDEDVAVYDSAADCTGLSLSDCSSLIYTNADWSSQDGSGDQSVDGNAPDFPDDLPSTFVIPDNFGSLPVEFTTIRATKNAKSVDVAWQTASELNNEMFVVERSKDGINFTAIGEVEGQGTSTRIQNYLLTDDAPLSGVSYYRVKQVDFDGAYDYSEMVSVTMDVKSIRVTPTATYDITTIYAEESTEIVVYDMTGATVTNMLPQNGQYDVDLSNAAKGIYMAVISYGTHTETVKLIRL